MHVCHVAVCLRDHNLSEVPRASVGSTLDSSVAGPRFEPHCPSRQNRIKRSGGSGKGKQRVGWQPPAGRGRWRGALLQVPGHIFACLCQCTKPMQLIKRK